MRFSFNRLKELAHLTHNLDVRDVVEALNVIGFEVETYYQWVPSNKVTIGKITKLDKHPNADRLFVLTVNVTTKNYQIVTSAKVDLHDVVAFFEPGAVVNGQILKPVQFFGVESHGMLCSLEEIIPDKNVIPTLAKEIFTLDDSYQLGGNLIKVLELDDWIIDIDILSNRSDANCYAILALELAAFFNTKWHYALDNKKLSDTFRSNVKVTNGVANHLTLFEAKVEAIQKSSWDIQILLMKSGIKPINEIVDLTAWTILEWNQPTHVYDLDTLSGNISAKKMGVTDVLMDNKSYTLDDVLAITDADVAISVAGVSGIKKYSITENSKNLLFEIANFDVKLIRETLQKSKYISESSNRFIRKINPNIIGKVTQFLKSKLDNYSNVVNAYPPQKITVDFDVKRLELYTHKGIAGENLYTQAIEKLRILGFVFDNNAKISVPFYRHDIEYTEDIIEEILRFISYENLPSTPPEPHGGLGRLEIVNEINGMMSGIGFYEVRSHTLVNEHEFQFNPFEYANPIVLTTFISHAKKFYRNSIIPSLLAIADYNAKRKIEDVALFEVGKVNGQDKDHLGIVSSEHDFFALKKMLGNLFGQFGDFTYKTLDKAARFFHPGLSAEIIFNGVNVGFIGKVNPHYMEMEFWVCELALDRLLELGQEKRQKFCSFYKDSYVVRDFTVDMQKQSVESVSDALKKYPCVVDWKVKDEYHNENAHTLTFRVFFAPTGNLEAELQNLAHELEKS